ncbi:MAG: glycosyltransferase [Sodaliphilus sp.]
MLIRAFAIVHLRFPDWTLHIVGDGEQKSRLQKIIIEENLTGCIRLEGRSADVAEWLLRSSIFALSSKMEGLPMVILEAMECGLPVVSCDCRYGPRDIIVDGYNGWLTPVGDENAFAEKLCAMIENESLRREMGKHAKETVQEYYPEALALRWMNLFNEMIES